MRKAKKIISAFLMVIVTFSSLFGVINVEAVSKIKKNKGDFYIALNKTLYDSSFSPGCYHKYKMYAFNVNSKAAKLCNKKLNSFFMGYYNRDQEAYANNVSLVHNIQGNTYKNGNILSIKQKVTGHSWYQYKSYNVNKKTGKKVTIASLYKKYGYTKRSFFNALKKKQIRKTREIINNCPGVADFADEMIAYAKSGESRKGLQVYLDNKGKLCVVAKINTFAGAGIYQYIFRFSKR